MTAFSPYRKRRELLVIGVEATRGVAATKLYAVRWLSKNLKSVPNILENESAMGNDVKVNDSAIDVWHSEGPVNGKVTTDAAGYLFNGVLNKITTVDNEDGTYTHTFERDPISARKTLSAYDIRPSGIRLYKSLTMDNLNLDIEVGDHGAWFEFSTGFKGWKHEDIGSLTPPAFTTGEKEFTSRMISVRFADDVAGLANSNAKIKPRKIGVAFEETTTVDHYVGETANDPELDSAPAEAKGSMVVKYRSTDIESDYFSNKIHAMSVTAQSDDEKIEIVGTRVRFREVTDSDSRDEMVTQTISYYFESDPANGGKDIVVKVTNKIASYVA